MKWWLGISLLLDVLILADLLILFPRRFFYLPRKCSLGDIVAADHVLIDSKPWISRRPHLGVLGWSIGAAAGLQFAEKCPLQDLVLIATFTTMENIVKKITGIRPKMLLLDRFDNLTAPSSVC